MRASEERATAPARTVLALLDDAGARIRLIDAVNPVAEAGRQLDHPLGLLFQARRMQQLGKGRALLSVGRQHGAWPTRREAS